MSESPDRSQVRLWISEDPLAPGVAAFWIGPLVALGGMASRYASEHSERQLIVAVSVPRRDFAAVLVGCGWILDSKAPCLDAPMVALRGMDEGTPVRLVTEQEVVQDHFIRFHDTSHPFVELRQSKWLASKVKAVAKLPMLEGPLRTPRPRAGSVGRWAKLESSWDDRLAEPAADLAIVGTRTWLEEDLAGGLGVDEKSDVGRHGYTPGEANAIDGLLRPKHEGAATWFTRLFASSRLADQLPLPKDVRAAVLDGAGAIKHLTEIEAPVVVCILDRSVADETAGEMVVQLRNARGEPCSLQDDLGWRAPAGVEALAFTVAL